MITLHRPPRAAFREPGIGTTEDVQICYESLDIILKLLRIYHNNSQNYSHLPITAVHSLASATSIILMKQHISGLSWKNAVFSKPLDRILKAMYCISPTWTSPRNDYSTAATHEEPR